MGEAVRDPLLGMRRRIARKEVSVLIWPAVGGDGELLPAPVKRGERFAVHGVPVIQIESCNRKLPAGKPAEWHASFVRLEVDRPQLLRRVPSGLPSAHDKSDGLSDIERARVEGNYTSSARMALVDEPESVGPDWKDHGVNEREKNRLAALREQKAEDLAREEARKLKARVDQVVIRTGKKGVDLTHELQPIYDRLNEMEEAA